MTWSPACVELGTYGSGADCRPSSFYQFWLWVEIFMRNGEKFFMVGLAAICWAWRARNNIYFEKKIVRSPIEIMYLASSFIFSDRIASCVRSPRTGGRSWSSQGSSTGVPPSRSYIGRHVQEWCCCGEGAHRQKECRQAKKRETRHLCLLVSTVGVVFCPLVVGEAVPLFHGLWGSC